MKNIVKHILIAIFVFLALASIFSVFVGPFEEVKQTTISELAARINEEKVDAIVIEENNLAIKLKDGTTESAKKEAGVSLLEILQFLANQDFQITLPLFYIAYCCKHPVLVGLW